jgi:hypothetical protein
MSEAFDLAESFVNNLTQEQKRRLSEICLRSVEKDRIEVYCQKSSTTYNLSERYFIQGIIDGKEYQYCCDIDHRTATDEFKCQFIEDLCWSDWEIYYFKDLQEAIDKRDELRTIHLIKEENCE